MLFVCQHDSANFWVQGDIPRPSRAAAATRDHIVTQSKDKSNEKCGMKENGRQGNMYARHKGRLAIVSSLC